MYSLVQIACPLTYYRGQATTDNIEFNRHLQYFSYQVSILYALYVNHKISDSEAHRQLLYLWEQLQPCCDLIAHETDDDKTEKFAFRSLDR
jgi:hypothetical protein